MPEKRNMSLEALKKYWEHPYVAEDPMKSRSRKHGKGLSLRVSQEEYAELSEKAEALGISKVELIIRAVRAYGKHSIFTDV